MCLEFLWYINYMTQTSTATQTPTATLLGQMYTQIEISHNEDFNAETRARAARRAQALSNRIAKDWH